MTLEARFEAYLKAQGLAITAVRIGDYTDRATWTVHPSSLQAEAQPHIDAFVLPTEAEALNDSALSESRRKDILATIAWSIRFKDVAAWNALTLAQKRAAVLAQADIWRDMRVFLD